jgi:hypothetical protein
MKRTFLIGAVLLSIFIADNAFSCGGDECDANAVCSDYYAPCEPATYIDDVIGPRSNFLLLLNTYIPAKEAETSFQKRDESRSEFDAYKQEIKEILEQKHLESVPLQHQYSYTYGAHPCLSNNYENALAFVMVAADDPKATPFLRDLVVVRDNILHLCANPNDEQKSSVIKSIDELKLRKGAEEYAAYLDALRYFYSGDYRKAIDIYQNLSAASSPWLRETSVYLIGRTKLVLSQEKWDGWNQFKGIDRDVLKSSEDAYKKYLTMYPNGRYSTSAKNIQRRIMFLRQDKAPLNHELERLFEVALQDKSGDSLGHILNEVLNCYQVDKVTFESPLITAYQLFLGVVPSQEDLNSIKNNRARYDKYPGLQAFLVNKSLFRQKKYQEIVDGRISESKETNPVTTALSTMRAEAYEQLGKYADARKVWQQIGASAGFAIYPNFIQMSLAHNYLNDNKIDLIATEGSGITDIKLIREIFENLGSDKLLEETIFSDKITAESKKIAQNVILTRYMLQKRYSDLLRIMKPVKDTGIFSEVETAARTLIKNEHDPKGLLNAGFFLYYHGIHPPSCGNSRLISKFKAKYPVNLDLDDIEPPIDYFTTALEQFSEKDKSEVEAKLLYYAIMSFKPSNKAFDSTWSFNHRDQNNGKEWYERLHRKYPDSEWAKKTKYYY